MKKIQPNWEEFRGYYITPRVVMENESINSPTKMVFCYILTLYLSGDDVHPSVTTIGGITNLSKSSVQRGIKELVTQGLITIVQHGNGRGYTSSYQVNEERFNTFFNCKVFGTPTENKDEKEVKSRRVDPYSEIIKQKLIEKNGKSY